MLTSADDPPKPGILSDEATCPRHAPLQVAIQAPTFDHWFLPFHRFPDHTADAGPVHSCWWIGETGREGDVAEDLAAPSRAMWGAADLEN